MAMAPHPILPVLLFVSLHCGTMAALCPDPRDFFAAKIGANLTKITWAHAANSKKEVADALTDDRIMMIEADVSMGVVYGNPNATIPIMAHPPATESDLSLEEFLNETLKSGTRGIKLDFKSIEAFKNSLPILKNNLQKMIVPVMLNADILPGPNSGDEKPVDANEFLQGAKQHFPQGMLSVGWKTQYGVIPATYTGAYTKEHIRSMLDALARNNVTQTVTYPVRAALAARDIALMQDLVKKTPNYKSTLSVWSSLGDAVDRKSLSSLITEVGVEKTYVDVPATVWRDLNLNSAGKASLASATLLIVGMLISTFGLFHSF